MEEIVSEDEAKKSNRVLVDKKSCIVCAHFRVQPGFGCKKGSRLVSGNVCSEWEVYKGIRL